MGELGVLIPIMIFAIPLLSMWTKHKKEMAQLQMQGTNEEAADRASHTQELEERVRVLERIITDRGFDVATQIEALRDARVETHKLEEQEQ